MFFTVALYTSLAIFAIGMLYKIITWFTRKVGFRGRQFTARQRFGAFLRGLVGVLFSAKLFALLRALILDVLLQSRIFKEDRLRWIMHMLIFSGFMMLFLMHAMEKHITMNLFPHYYSTLNPFFFLRNLFGLMVIVGVGIAIYRRFIIRVPRLMSGFMDKATIVIVGVIILSGFLLEGAKMSSHTEFTYMVEDYAAIWDDEELEALESYWVQEFGTVSPTLKRPFTPEVLEMGYESHLANCADCHSPNKTAFLGYATARAIAPVALFLDRVNAVGILWYVHILACFIGLAYLPFSKMLHMFSSTLTLLANAVMDPEHSLPANIATRQVLELDACTRCGTCNLRCSVSVAFEAKGNRLVLPAQKLAFLREYVRGGGLSREDLRAVHEGFYLCTNCDRCTVVCPAGINLRELWLSVREPLLATEGPTFHTLSPFSLFRGLNRHRLPAEGYERPVNEALETMAAKFPLVRDTAAEIAVTPIDTAFKAGAGNAADRTDTFVNCFACENCTTVCPVVQAFDDPQAAVGLLPHQIMRSLGLGLKDLALGAPMLWHCLTCYQCQEHCPQGVKVTDVLYELKNQAVREASCVNNNDGLRVKE